ncbi:MAG: pentapeptide repeat-containing protein [Cyanobacteria bacterium P01_G01_bin.39]
MDREELLERYTAGERDFNSVEIPGIDLSNLDLCRIQLAYAEMEGANFSGTNLSEGCLQSSWIERVNFSRANLYGIDFYETCWDGIDFTGACLVGTNLEIAYGKANLTNANLIGAINFSNDEAIFQNTIMPDGQIVNVVHSSNVVESQYPRTLYLCDLPNLKFG